MGGVIMKISKILLAAMVLSTVATGVLAEDVKTWDIVPTNRNTNENYHVTLNYLNSRPESYANVDTNLDFIRIHDKNDQITEISGGSVSVHSKDRQTHNDLYPGYFSMIGDNNSFEARTGYLRLLNGPENGETELDGRNITIMSVDGDERYAKFGLDEINAGNQQINNVKAGVADTDAVNVRQLKEVEAEAKKHTTVVAGDNTTVTTSTNTNGGTEYKVAVNKDVDLTQEGSLRTGKTKVSNYGLKVKAADNYYTVVTTGEVTVNEPDGSGTLTNGNVILYNYTDGSASKLNTKGVIAEGPDRSVLFTTEGIYAGDQIINAVKAGVEDTDAVNVAQLKRLQDQITASSSVTTVTAGDHIKVTPTVNGNTRDYKVSLADDTANQINNNTTNITNNTTNINKNAADIKNIKGGLSKMDKRIDKSVAGAAALAALHPLDFDPDAKWDFAAGYGHYRGGDAVAIGAFYRPNEDVQLSIGSTVDSDETVFNAGLSVKVGAHSGVSRSRVAIGKEVLALKKTVAEQNAQIQKLTALLNGVDGTKMKADHTTLFPDVAANHWAYEAVSDLSRRGLVEGYPDGTFGGDRLLTRYEFAQIVYRAIQDGVTVDDRLVTEFSPEMALFRVDTIAKNAQGEPTIERVRVNKK